MGIKKINIYLDGGSKKYKDTEGHNGKTITTSVDPGDKIEWAFNDTIGLSKIAKIKPSSESFFSKEPAKDKYSKKWSAVVAKDAKGEISYDVTLGASTISLKSTTSADGVKDEDPPKLEIKD